MEDPGDVPPMTREPKPPGPPAETDPRFPSGPWIGFFLQRERPGRHGMELHLHFSQGVVKGEGRDYVGPFVLTGRYSVEDGRCHWTKRYIHRHDVFYQGYNEGKGIWGTWDIPPGWRGGFQIWPKKWGDSPDARLGEAIDAPVEEEETLVVIGVESEELVPAGVD